VITGLKTRGAVIEDWDHFGPQILGVKPAGAMANTGYGSMAYAAGPALAEGRSDKPWHPDSPLFWFGAVLAVTLGLIGASTSIRVGPFKADLSAGK
jgi:hypothetical protein